MKLCRLQPLALGQLERGRSASARFDIPAHAAEIEEGVAYQIAGVFPNDRKRTGLSWALKTARLLQRVEPGKIVGVGRNYREHALELDHPIPVEPLIFLKPPSSVIGPEEPILLPAISKRVDHEGELAVIIGRTCSQLSDRDAVEPYVLGYSCLNDVTARDLQKADVQFTRGKSFDTFCPLGPVIETTLDLGQTRVQTFVNGMQRQSGALTEMIFPVDVIIRWISRVMTLLPGDVIAT